jgi:hypothetical protein
MRLKLQMHQASLRDEAGKLLAELRRKQTAFMDDLKKENATLSLTKLKDSLRELGEGGLAVIELLEELFEELKNTTRATVKRLPRLQADKYDDCLEQLTKNISRAKTIAKLLDSEEVAEIRPKPAKHADPVPTPADSTDAVAPLATPEAAVSVPASPRTCIETQLETDLKQLFAEPVTKLVTALQEKQFEAAKPMAEFLQRLAADLDSLCDLTPAQAAFATITNRDCPARKAELEAAFQEAKYATGQPNDKARKFRGLLNATIECASDFEAIGKHLRHTTAAVELKRYAMAVKEEFEDGNNAADTHRKNVAEFSWAMTMAIDAPAESRQRFLACFQRAESISEPFAAVITDAINKLERDACEKPTVVACPPIFAYTVLEGLRDELGAAKSENAAPLFTFAAKAAREAHAAVVARIGLAPGVTATNLASLDDLEVSLAVLNAMEHRGSAEVKLVVCTHRKKLLDQLMAIVQQQQNVLNKLVNATSIALCPSKAEIHLAVQWATALHGAASEISSLSLQESSKRVNIDAKMKQSAATLLMWRVNFTALAYDDLAASEALLLVVNPSLPVTESKELHALLAAAKQAYASEKAALDRAAQLIATFGEKPDSASVRDVVDILRPTSVATTVASPTAPTPQLTARYQNERRREQLLVALNQAAEKATGVLATLLKQNENVDASRIHQIYKQLEALGVGHTALDAASHHIKLFIHEAVQQRHKVAEWSTAVQAVEPVSAEIQAFGQQRRKEESRRRCSEVQELAKKDHLVLKQTERDQLATAVLAALQLDAVAAQFVPWRVDVFEQAIMNAKATANTALETMDYATFFDLVDRCVEGSVAYTDLQSIFAVHCETTQRAFETKASTHALTDEYTAGVKLTTAVLKEANTPVKRAMKASVDAIVASLQQRITIATDGMRTAVKARLDNVTEPSAGCAQSLVNLAVFVLAMPSVVSKDVATELGEKVRAALNDATAQVEAFCTACSKGFTTLRAMTVTDIVSLATVLDRITETEAMVAALTKLHIGVTSGHVARLQASVGSVPSTAYVTAADLSPMRSIADLQTAKAKFISQLNTACQMRDVTSSQTAVVEAGEKLHEGLARAVAEAEVALLLEWTKLTPGSTITTKTVTHSAARIDACYDTLTELVNALSSKKHHALAERDVIECHDHILLEVERWTSEQLDLVVQNRRADNVEAVAADVLLIYQKGRLCVFAQATVTKALEDGLKATLENDRPYRSVMFAHFRSKASSGGDVLCDFEAFRMERQRERAAVDMISPEVAVNKKMRFGEGDVPSAQVDLLINTLREVMERKFNYHLQAVSKCSDMDAALQTLQRAVSKHAQEASLSSQREALVDLVAVVSFAMSWLTSGRDYLVERDSNVLFRAHAVQMGTILRILRLDRCASKLSIVDELNKLATAKTSTAMLDGHMVEIPTGQGKSVALGITACVLALLGRQVDVVCYSQQLTDRDAAELKPLFEFCGVQDRVSYLTYQGVMERRAGGIREAVLAALGTAPPPHAKTTAPDNCPERRVLLLDEVDVLFTDAFSGLQSLYNPTARYVRPTVNALLHHIFTVRADAVALSNIETEQVFLDLIREDPKLEQFIRSQVSQMVAQVKDFGTSNSYPTADQPYNYVVDRQMGIGYYDSDGTINFRVAPPGGWYRAAFACIHELSLGNLDVDVGCRVSLPLICPGFSYADMPRQSYCAVFGVTGTLVAQEALAAVTQQSNGHKELLEESCNVKHWTYTDPIVVSQTPKWAMGDTVMVAAGGDAAKEWCRTIATMIKEIQKEHNVDPDSAAVAVAETYPIVVTFEDPDTIQAFLNEIPGFRDQCQVICRNTPLREVQRRIHAATEGNTVTLVDRAFSRGTDFKCKRCTLLTLIQTYLPATVSEELQLRGRTGRQGQPGKVKVILCPDQVAAALKPPTGSKIAPTSPIDIYAAFASIQCPEYLCVNTRNQLETERLAWHQASLAQFRAENQAGSEFSARMLDPTVDIATKKDLVIDKCTPATGNPSYLFLIDGSNSMMNKYEGRFGRLVSAVKSYFVNPDGVRWQDTCAAFKAAAECLKRTSPSTFVGIILFGRKGTSKTVFEGPASALDPDVLASFTPTLDTEYFEAFDAGCNLMEKNAAAVQGCALNVVFLTDGEDDPSKKLPPRVATDAVKRLCANRAVASYHCLTVDLEGNNDARKSLDAIEAVFRNQRAFTCAHQIHGAAQMLSAFDNVIVRGKTY